MVSRPNPKDVEDLRKTILKVRKWWKSGPSLAGFFAEVWAAAAFTLEEPRDNKANLPYDAKDARGRKIGIKGRAETPYTKRTGKGLSYFGFRARELDECDAFYLIAFNEQLVAKLCVEAPAHVVADYAEGVHKKRLTFTQRKFERFLALPHVKARIPGSKDAVRWRQFGLGAHST